MCYLVSLPVLILGSGWELWSQKAYLQLGKREMADEVFILWSPDIGNVVDMNLAKNMLIAYTLKA